MKRSPPKVILRRETLRILVSLDLTRVVGGDTAQLGDTGTEMGTRVPMVDTGAAACTNQVALKPPGG
jgi:hypothetical protein